MKFSIAQWAKAHPIHRKMEPTSPTVDSRSTTDGDPKLPIPMSTADPPFDKETTDVVLQTSDRFQFHVWKCILAQASPVFEDMFALGEPLSHNQEPEADTNKEKGAQVSPSRPSVPVIEIPEDCATLRLLLQWNYPPSHSKLIGKPGLELSELKPILAAAHKYQMDGVVLEITDTLINGCSKLGPLRVYAIGVRYGFHDVMQVAAQCFLSLPTSAADAYVEELEDISGGVYHRLCQYRRECIATLAEMAKDLTWLSDGAWTFKKGSLCTCVADPTGTKYRFKAVDTEYVLSTWFIEHYQRMVSLLQDRPCQEAIADEQLREQALKEGSKCLVCREVVHYHMRLFTNKNLKPEVVRRIAAARNFGSTSLFEVG